MGQRGRVGGGQRQDLAFAERKNIHTPNVLVNIALSDLAV